MIFLFVKLMLVMIVVVRAIVHRVPLKSDSVRVGAVTLERRVGQPPGVTTAYA